MNNGYTGGPAFPVSADILSIPEPKAVMGMTLRDYFAAKALQGMLAASTRQQSDEHMFARDAYKVSDAMLLERAK